MILARLRRAIQEQNWFAVVLEVLIVIVGVVIGFQITAWGQAQADRAQEQTYLRLLAEDLRTTEQEIAEADAWLMPRETASGAVLRSFDDPTRPHPDSLREHVFNSIGYYTFNPVTGTAEALVATGGLSLIRDDSLRSAITQYLRSVRGESETQIELHRNLLATFQTLQLGRDPSGYWDLVVSRRDRFSPGDPLYPFSPGPRRSTIGALDVEAFLSDPAMEVAASNAVLYKLEIRASRERVLAATVALREQVEAEIER